MNKFEVGQRVTVFKRPGVITEIPGGQCYGLLQVMLDEDKTPRLYADWYVKPISEEKQS